MISRVVAAMAGVTLALSVAGAAQAQIRLDRPLGGGVQPQQPQQPSSTIDGISPEQAIRLLSQVGFSKGEVLKLDNNLKAVKAEVNGTPVFAVFFGCEGDKCSNFAYATFFGKQNVSQAFINGFNRDRRYARLYTDKEGNLALTMDVWMYGGVSPAFVATTGAMFATTIKWLVEYRPE